MLSTNYILFSTNGPAHDPAPRKVISSNNGARLDTVNKARQGLQTEKTFGGFRYFAVYRDSSAKKQTNTYLTLLTLIMSLTCKTLFFL